MARSSDQALTSLRPACQTPGPPSSTAATSSTAGSGGAAWPRSSWPATSCSTGPVAVKVLFPEFATDPAFVERFRREATAAANLNHPNIVGVYDWGEADGTYFIVMEYVDGRTLSEILRAEGPLHPDRAADVGADVAAALGFAHRNGVVHRDVKPGQRARHPGRPGEGGRLRHRPGHHRQRRREPHPGRHGHGHRHLLLARAGPRRRRRPSLGHLLARAACSTSSSSGAPRSPATRPVAIAYKHVQESPTPPRQLNPELPTAIEAIILKCLAKNPANRYPTAEDLRADLRRFREGNSILAEPVMVAADRPGRHERRRGHRRGRGGRRAVLRRGRGRRRRPPIVGALPRRAHRPARRPGRDALPALPAVRRRR